MPAPDRAIALDPLFHNARFALAAPSWNTLPPSLLPEVAFVGRSNVGKSSLLNALLGRKALAHISKTPGKTRAFNFYLLGDGFYFVDLPGYGYAKVSQTERDRWARLIEQYVTERASLKLVLHLVDGRHDPTALDREVFRAMAVSPVPHLVVLTKADKLSGNERPRRVRAVQEALVETGKGAPVVLTSSQTGRGLETVRDWIMSVVAPPPADVEVDAE